MAAEVVELGTTEQGGGCGYLQGSRVDEVAEKTKLNGQPWMVSASLHRACWIPGLGSIG